MEIFRTRCVLVRNVAEDCKEDFQAILEALQLKPEQVAFGDHQTYLLFPDYKAATDALQKVHKKKIGTDPLDVVALPEDLAEDAAQKFGIPIESPEQRQVRDAMGLFEGLTLENQQKLMGMFEQKMQNPVKQTSGAALSATGFQASGSKRVSA